MKRAEISFRVSQLYIALFLETNIHLRAKRGVLGVWSSNAIWIWFSRGVSYSIGERMRKKEGRKEESKETKHVIDRYF